MTIPCSLAVSKNPCSRVLSPSNVNEILLLVNIFRMSVYIYVYSAHTYMNICTYKRTHMYMYVYINILTPDGIDYFSMERDVTFRSSEVSKSVLIQLTDDDVFPEPNKTFQVYIRASPGVYLSPTAYVTARILNDDEQLRGCYACCSCRFLGIQHNIMCIHIRILWIPLLMYIDMAKMSTYM